MNKYKSWNLTCYVLYSKALCMRVHGNLLDLVHRGSSRVPNLAGLCCSQVFAYFVKVTLFCP